MKMNIYNNRLMKFAQHLYTLDSHPERGLYEIVTLVAIEGHVLIPYDFKYPNYLFDELSHLFDEWELSEKTGEAVLKDSSERNTIFDICTFFDLSLDELSIFDLDGCQLIDRFGGKKLSTESPASDIAFNIIELIKKRKEAENESEQNI